MLPRGGPEIKKSRRRVDGKSNSFQKSGISQEILSLPFLACQRRVEIPKPDGGTRPLGFAALEDKIVQTAVAETILAPIFEPEFLGFSYGFRPGRGAHDALDALAYGIERRKVNWIVDADIRAFLESSSYCPPVHSSCSNRLG